LPHSDSYLVSNLTKMKQLTHLFIAVLACTVFFSCKKDKDLRVEASAISDETLAAIKALGFSTADVKKHEEGFLVEGDIVVTPEMIENGTDEQLLRVAEEEQYRTTNLVKISPLLPYRTITIRVSTALPARYITATNAAIARYNARNLRLRFARVTSGGNILISKAPSSATYLASAGFPSAAGNPYTSVLVNSTYLDDNAWNINSVTSILAHEVGHCIGFRHTDYMHREYSCGGGHVAESSVNAIHIPGTPVGPDPNSWMLACIGKNVNRPFNANDRVALNYLY
jgi:hypothetical protein